MPDFRLSETTIAGTPPKKAKARVCEPIQSGSDCVPWSPSTGNHGRHAPERATRPTSSPRAATASGETQMVTTAEVFLP
ncbi:hypothetical protein NWI01_35010 [Nitrobacter winogradskyi]|uniref:Uncharacterized protein n=1 Tax=Nitrobacter winogradskyi TaxID=913 RepID=A0A4Y3WI87_NITWI|nr:hypothetical protein NWI01_35010 [Nitrobacter winogradskyi]